MPQQKATSFADDLAALGQESSFAADLAALDKAQPAPAEKPSSGKFLAEAAVGTMPALVAAGKQAAGYLANNPLLARAAAFASKRAPGLSVVGNLITGNTSPMKIARDAALAYSPALLRKAAGVAATHLPVSPVAIGAGAGLSVPALLMAGIQADANREAKIDPESNTPAGNILKGFLTMAGQR